MSREPAESFDEFLDRMRLLEVDHEPDGWPGVRMRDITRLCDIAQGMVPALDRLQDRLEAGCQIKRQDGKWYMFAEDGDAVCPGGDTVRALLVNLVFSDC